MALNSTDINISVINCHICLKYPLNRIAGFSLALVYNMKTWGNKHQQII